MTNPIPKISKEMKVSELLERHPQLLEVLVAYHPHFQKLRNKLLRRIMAPRVTLDQAARIAGVEIETLLTILYQSLQSPSDQGAAGERSQGHTLAQNESSFPCSTGPKPPGLDQLPAHNRVEVDVRPELRAGQEPYVRIMKAVASLKGDQTLVLRTIFEPFPLYEVLAGRGFAHWAEAASADDWTVYFYRRAAEEGTPEQPPAVSAMAGGEDRSGSPHPPHLLDVRGLEPPQPMIQILEALNTLPVGDTLLVRHERRPLFLYPRLDERGFEHTTEEVAPGDVRLTIRHRRQRAAGSE